MTFAARQQPVMAGSPAEGAADWANWFGAVFLPDWLARVQDAGRGVFDTLDADGRPLREAPKTLLAQARTLFTLAHLALVSGDAGLAHAARIQAGFLSRFRKAPGLYRRALARDGDVTGQSGDEVARSYDQTFVLLALATQARLDGASGAMAEAETCWQALSGPLTDPATGLLREDDSVTDPAAHEAPPRAQNPHMHLYEACLQAFGMTGDALWMRRAQGVRATALAHFLDADSGTIAEFLTPALHPLPGVAGLRREVGHQCEWAWLLAREAELGGDPAMSVLADRLMHFALRHGFATTGPMAGAVVDAVSARGEVMENTFLLWPQTEAIKALALRHGAGDPDAGAMAQRLLCRMFQGWFAGRPAFVNQLDQTGATLWPEALTRLVYHVSLALTEGARAQLWPGLTRT